MFFFAQHLCLILFVRPVISSQSDLDFSRILQRAPWYGRENPQIHGLNSFLSHDSNPYPPGSALLYGGSYGSFPPKYLNDVWITSDSTSWLQISNASAIFPSKFSHCLCSHPTADQLYAIPQNDNSKTHTGVSQIWTTSTLTDWTPTAPSSISPKVTSLFVDHYDVNCFVDRHSNLYYLLGNNQTGSNLPNPSYNQTWRSTDSGRTWTQRTDSVPFAARYKAMSGVHVNNTHLQGKDLLYILGGTADQERYYLNDIWVSSDGAITWAMVPGSLDFNGYALSDLLITRHGLLIINAFSPPASKLYISFDGGLSWPQCSSGASYGLRSHPGMSLSTDGYLYIYGGWVAGTRDYMNDVWRSSFSLLDLEQLASACQTTLPAGGIGLQRWPGGASSSKSSSSTGLTAMSSSTRMTSSIVSTAARSPSSSSSGSRIYRSSSSSRHRVDPRGSSTGEAESSENADWELWAVVITVVIVVIMTFGVILYLRHHKRRYGRMPWWGGQNSGGTSARSQRLLESELQ